MAADDEFLDKAVEGLVLYAFNKGEVCTCPSRALIQESIYDEFMARCLERIARDPAGQPARPHAPSSAPQISRSQLEKIESYVQIGKRRGRRTADRRPAQHARRASSPAATTTSRPSSRAHNDMRIFQEEIFGPVLAVTTFKDEAEALQIANDTLYGLGAGVWTRDGARAFRMGRGDQGRAGVDQLLPPLPRARRVRRLQGLGRGAREPQDDARPLLPDQVPAGQLRPAARWASSRGDTKRGGVATCRGERDRDRRRGRADRAPARRARSARLLPVRRLLRRQPRRSAWRTASCHRAPATCCSARSAAPVLCRRRAVPSAGATRRFARRAARGAAEGFSLSLPDAHFVTRAPPESVE